MNNVLVPSVSQILDRMNREFVGFNDIRNLLADTGTVLNPQAYPPYNIEQIDEEHWAVDLAVAGFTSDDIDISQEDKVLKITGKARQEVENERVFLYRGIAERAFERRFVLSEGVRVTDAKLQDGLLRINFERLIPEEKKPRRIEIQS